MLENLNDEKTNITEEVCNTINPNLSIWDADDAVEKKLRKRRKEIKRLKKKLKRKCRSRKENKKKIKSLKKQIKELQNEKERKEERLKTQLLRANHQNDILRLFCMLQMDGGKEYLAKQLWQSSQKGVLQNYEKG